MLRVANRKIANLISVLAERLNTQRNTKRQLIVSNIINAYGNDILEYALTISKVFYTGKYEKNSAKHGAMQ